MRSADQLEVFDNQDSMSRIGSGTLGGKANGLVFISEMLRRRFNNSKFPEVTVGIPWMTVIAADFFVEFMERNDLYEIAHEDQPDDRIAHAFQKAELPARLVGDLRSVATRTRVPLAIRSSSLLEDALYRPFAGVYATKMIPNNQPSADERYRRLVEAIKFVYASTFFNGAKRYRQTLGEDGANEKMAVIIQQIVGQRFGDRFYPNLSGVARSFNFYPFGHARPEDGVVDLALGLGKSIVDGGQVWSYCPAYPKSPPPYNNIGDLLKNTQTDFWAVGMGRPPAYNPVGETEYLVNSDLAAAEYDDVLRQVASTYNPAADRIVPGVGPDGPRILDFAPLLTFNEPPVNSVITELLASCEEALETEVEIEFAMTWDRETKKPAQLGFLQVRPMVVQSECVDLQTESIDKSVALVASDKALGNSRRDDIVDVVYVPPETFDAKSTVSIAAELERVNLELSAERRPYLLIGFGRFGTSDPWRGIPVTWDQISWARAIVETSLPGFETDTSQGSHFFHNVTSFKVAFFSVSRAGTSSVDFDWLRQRPAVSEMRFVRHVRLDRPLNVLVDGRRGKGIILRDGG